jgi:hypothetical protein
MKPVIVFAGVFAATLVLATQPRTVHGNEKPGEPQHDGTPEHALTPTSDFPRLTYRPPPRGAPTRRRAAGTRGASTHLRPVSVLAPDHVGLTIQSQPRLYWYLSQVVTEPVEFTLNDERRIAPLVEVRLTSPTKPGIQQIQLADHGVRLDPDVGYEWSIAIVPDPDRRSKDIISSGWIERIPVPEDLAANLAGAGKALTPGIYAEAGIWYDALGVLSDLIAETPDDPRPHLQRATLLDQVGLADAARAERALIGPEPR